jgi:DNA-binding transcriptional ArsR family regulator
MSELIYILKALSNETRYKILELLIENSYCVKALAKKLNITESAISQHLKILRNAGIVKGEKKGYYTHYTVNLETLQKVADKISDLAKVPLMNKEVR